MFQVFHNRKQTVLSKEKIWSVISFYSQVLVCYISLSQSFAPPIFSLFFLNPGTFLSQAIEHKPVSLVCCLNFNLVLENRNVSNL